MNLAGTMPQEILENGCLENLEMSWLEHPKILKIKLMEQKAERCRCEHYRFRLDYLVRGCVLIREGWIIGLNVYYFALLIGKKEEEEDEKNEKKTMVL
jgi:hypothetical protein